LRSGRLGFVLTSQGTTRVPFGQRRRRCHHGNHLGLVLASRGRPRRRFLR
jgi:hypothetical protein